MTSSDSPLDALFAGLAVQVPPPPEPLSWADMLALLPDPARPVAARLDMDPIVSAHLTAAAEPAARPWAPVGDLGTPIVVDPDLPLGAWRIIDTDGNVMHEGNLFDRREETKR